MNLIVIEGSQHEGWEQIHVVDLKSETALHNYWDRINNTDQKMIKLASKVIEINKKWIIEEAAINSDYKVMWGW